MTAAEVLDALMALPPEVRRELALFALESLDEPSEYPVIEVAWDRELQRRWSAIESGAEKTIPHDEAMEFIFGALPKQAG